MPNAITLKRARHDARNGKSASTQAGEFVREGIRRIRAGAYGARSARQAIAIGLSEARRAGIALAASASASAETRRRASRDMAASRTGRKPSKTRSRARTRALKREGRSAASKRPLAMHARAASRNRGPKARSASARQAAETRQRRAA